MHMYYILCRRSASFHLDEWYGRCLTRFSNDTQSLTQQQDGWCFDYVLLARLLPLYWLLVSYTIAVDIYAGHFPSPPSLPRTSPFLILLRRVVRNQDRDDQGQRPQNQEDSVILIQLSTSRLSYSFTAHHVPSMLQVAMMV